MAIHGVCRGPTAAVGDIHRENLDERLAWNAFAGMGLILVGLCAIDGRLPAMLKRRGNAS